MTTNDSSSEKGIGQTTLDEFGAIRTDGGQPDQLPVTEQAEATTAELHARHLNSEDRANNISLLKANDSPISEAEQRFQRRGDQVVDGVNTEDPRCSECGEPIGMTATYCMHCSADLTDTRTRSTADEDGAETGTKTPSSITYSPEPVEDSDSDRSQSGSSGILADLLKAAVGLIGGFVIGLIVMIVIVAIIPGAILGVLLGSAVGIIVWIGTTTYVVLKPTVQEAISKAAYGIGIAILLFPLIVFSTTWDGGTRITDFIILEFVCLFPAGIVFVGGFIAAQFIPESDSEA